jgi:hypothetical protein
VILVLSHRERRILLGIERQLKADDPELARKFRSHTTVRRVLCAALRLGAGVLALAAVMCILLAAPQAAPTLITFAAVLLFISYLPH